MRAEQSDAAGNVGVSPAVVFKSGLTYAQEVLADAPRGYWRLGEAGGTTAADLGSAQNAGAYQGGPLLGQAGALLGDSDKALKADGVNDNVNFGDPANESLDLGTTDFSIELWMKTTVNNSQSVIGKQGASGANWQLLVTNAASQLGKLRATFSDGTTSRQGFSSVRVDDGLWHHVVVTFTRTAGMDIYVDGDRANRPGALTTSISNTAAMQIGRVTGYPYFNGSLDEVAIYPSALSQSRVLAHLAAAQGPDSAAPVPTITGPGSPTNDTRPTFTGRAGTLPGDAAQVSVRVYTGSTATGSPVQTLSTTAAANKVWSVNASAPLADGTYTAVVSQGDSAGNTGTASRTFAISAPTTPPDYRAVVMAAGPRGYWRMGEGAGASTGRRDEQQQRWRARRRCLASARPARSSATRTRASSSTASMMR